MIQVLTVTPVHHFQGEIFISKNCEYGKEKKFGYDPEQPQILSKRKIPKEQRKVLRKESSLGEISEKFYKCKHF